MRTTIDKAGRVVIPKELRDQVGIVAGEVELTTDGAAIRLEPVAGSASKRKRGRIVIPAAGMHLDDAMVRDLRDADHR